MSFKTIIEKYTGDSKRYPGDYEDVNKFKAWSTKLINAFAKDVVAAGWTIEKKSKGHFHLSLFASKDGKFIYLSWDARSCMGIDSVLVRTAKSTSDYTGGNNNFTDTKSITEFVKDRF